jgi:hypothetical protein
VRLGAVTAQAQADLITRLRSSGTFYAFPLICLGAYLWIPKPGGRAASITWRSAEGVVQTPVFDSAYAGTATTILGSIFVVLVAFYLLSGSLRLDRDRVGVLVAAAPITKSDFLLGKFFAYAGYLAVVCLLILGVGLVRFAAYGQGPWVLGSLLLPFLLVVGPGVVFVAAATLLFEVTPGLRGRGGLVLWFFAATLLLIVLPGSLSRGFAEGRFFERVPFFDPAGTASLQVAIRGSFGARPPDAMSTGLVIGDQVPEAVRWNGLTLDTGFVAARLGSFAWALLPLAASIVLFDRFDPARRTGQKARFFRRAIHSPSAEPPPASMAMVFPLAPVHPRPSPWAAVRAEAHLVWDTASWLRWPLLCTALAAPLFSGEAARLGAGAFLLLLAPVISEAAAREHLEGTRGLVFSQPSIPAWPVLAKLGGVLLFVLALGAPLTVRVFVTDPALGLTLTVGLTFVATFAVAAGIMTHGGKLFTGIYLMLWYGALNGAPALDFCGALSGRPRLATALTYLAAGTAITVAAAFVERQRQRA